MGQVLGLKFGVFFSFSSPQSKPEIQAGLYYFLVANSKFCKLLSILSVTYCGNCML